MKEVENVKISDGILLVRSKSGTSKIHKVIVHTKPGRRRSYVKWFEELIVKKKKKPSSRIPVLVTNHRRKNEKGAVKVSRSSTTIVRRRNVWSGSSSSPQMRSKLSISVPREESDVEILPPPESSGNFANQKLLELSQKEGTIIKPDSGVDSFLSQTDSSGNDPSLAKFSRLFKTNTQIEESREEDSETEEKTEKYKTDTSQSKLETDTQVEGRENDSESSDECVPQTSSSQANLPIQSTTDTQNREDESEIKDETSEELKLYKLPSLGRLRRPYETKENSTQTQNREDESEIKEETSEEFKIYKPPSEAKLRRRFETEEDSETQEEFKILTLSHSSTSYLLDNEVLISPPSLKSVSTSQRTEPTLEMLEKEFDDDEGGACVDEIVDLRDRIERFQKPEFLEVKHTPLVMTQYETTGPAPSSAGDNETSEPAPEKFGDIELSESSESVYVRRYIDSGLRPHKSEEARLYLDQYTYKRKRLMRGSDEEEIPPLLEEIPSNLFPRHKKEKKTEPEPSQVWDHGDVESQSEQTLPSQASKIDSDQLHKLKQFEDVSFIIKAGEEEQKNICVHIADVSDDKFSTSSVGYKDDICIHVLDPPGISEYSPESSSAPTVVAPAGEIRSEKRIRPRTPQRKCVCFKEKTTETATELAEYSESSAIPKCATSIWKTLKMPFSSSAEERKHPPTPKDGKFVHKPKPESRSAVDVSTCECKKRRQKSVSPPREVVSVATPIPDKLHIISTKTHEPKIVNEPIIRPVIHLPDQAAVKRRSYVTLSNPSSSESPSSTLTISPITPHNSRSLLLESNKERRRLKFENLERKGSSYPNSSDMTDFRRGSFSSRSLTPSSSSMIPQKPKHKRKRSKSQKEKKKDGSSSKSTSSENKD